MRAKDFRAREWCESQVETAIVLDGGLMSPMKAIANVKARIIAGEFNGELTRTQQAAALRALDILNAVRAVANATS